MRLLPSNPFHIELCLSLSSRDWHSYLSSRGYASAMPLPDDLASVTHLDEEHTYMVLHINPGFRKQPRQQQLSLLVHEVTHVWQNILIHLNEPKPGYELEANSQEWLFGWVYESLRKAKWL